MAKFDAEIGLDIIKQMDKLDLNSTEVFGKMVSAGADVVLRNIRSNMRGSYKTVRSLEAGLGKTKVFRTKSDDGIAVKVGFRGYNDQGVPIPLIATAREKGTKRGEAKKPFFRKSFNKAMIQSEMQRIEPRLFEGVK